MQYPIALLGVGGWVYFKLNLVIRMVKKLHFTSEINLAESCLAC